MSEMQELDHSPLGGSAAARFFACAGSFLLQRELYEVGELENSDSYHARKGTAAHALAAKALEEDQEPFMYVGEVFDGFTAIAGAADAPDYESDDEEALTFNIEAVQVYFNACYPYMQRKGRKLIEERIALPDLHPLLKGQVDFGFLSTSEVAVIDYKNGGGVAVSVEGNAQLLYYAFLMIMANDWWRESAPETLPVTLAVVQPNYYGEFSEPETWVTSIGYVKEWGHTVLLPTMQRLSATKDIASNDFVLGDHCVFCPVMLDCPSMQSAWEQYARADEKEIVEMLTDKEADAYFAVRDAVKRFGKALDAVVQKRLEDGKSFQNAKLVDKRGTRVWKNGVETKISRELGEAAYVPKKLKSPAQIEKVSARGKELALEYAFKNDNTGRTVALMSDKRPASVSKASDKVFAHIVEALEYDL